MPFPFENVQSPEQFAAQIAYAYELSEGQPNELDDFITALQEQYSLYENGTSMRSNVMRSSIGIVLTAARQLKTAAQEAVAAQNAEDYETGRQKMKTAAEQAMVIGNQIQSLRELYGEDEKLYTDDFQNAWESKDRPGKKYEALAGTYKAPAMPRDMSEKGKWRWVIEQNTGEDLPLNSLQEKKRALALALAAYKYANDVPVTPYSRSKLNKAADALMKDPVFTFLTNGHGAADALLRGGDLANLSANVSNRYDIEDPRYIDRLLDELGETMAMDTPAEGRSAEWKDFHRFMTEYKSRPNQSTQERVNQTLDKVEKYIKGKKSLRHGIEGQASFDLAMNALAIIAEASPAAKARVDAIIADINHVRTHRPWPHSAQPTVDLSDYGRQNALQQMEKAERIRLKQAPRTLGNTITPTAMARETEELMKANPANYALYDMNNEGLTRQVAKMFATALAARRVPRYQRVRQEPDGRGRMVNIPETVADESEYRTTVTDLMEDPVVFEMTRRFMTDVNFRIRMLTNGRNAVLAGQEMSLKAAQEYEQIHREQEWVQVDRNGQAADAPQTLQRVRRMAAQINRQVPRLELPALPAGAQPMLLTDIIYGISPYTRYGVTYPDKNTQFLNGLINALAMGVAMTTTPAYRMKDETREVDERDGQYVAVVDAQAFQAKVDELKADPALRALAHRMIENKELREQITLDFELAEFQGVPKGMPIPPRSTLGFANHAAVALADIRLQMENAAKYGPEENLVEVEPIRSEVQKKINILRTNGGDETKKETIDRHARTLAEAIFLFRAEVKQRRMDGKIVDMTDALAYIKTLEELENDPAVRRLAKKLAADDNFRRDMTTKELYGMGQQTVDLEEFGRMANEALFAEKQAILREEQELTAALKGKIANRRAQNAAKWEEAKKKREEQAKKEAGKPVQPIRYNERGIPIAPLLYDANGVPYPPEAPAEVPDIKEPIKKEAPKPAKEPEVPKVMCATLRRSSDPEVLPELPKCVEKAEPVRKLLTAVTGLDLAFVRNFDEEDLAQVKRLTAVTLTSLVLSTLPAYKTPVNGEMTAVYDAKQFEAQTKTMSEDPVVKRMIRKMIDDEKTMDKALLVREPYEPPRKRYSHEMPQAMKDLYEQTKKEMLIEAGVMEAEKKPSVGDPESWKDVSNLEETKYSSQNTLTIDAVQLEMADAGAKMAGGDKAAAAEGLAELLAMHRAPAKRFTVFDDQIEVVTDRRDIKAEKEKILADPAFKALGSKVNADFVKTLAGEAHAAAMADPKAPEKARQEAGAALAGKLAGEYEKLQKKLGPAAKNGPQK